MREPGRRPVVVFEPATPGVPSFFTEGGVAVRYNGEMTGELRRCLTAARQRLRKLSEGK